MNDPTGGKRPIVGAKEDDKDKDVWLGGREEEKEKSTGPDRNRGPIKSPK